MLRLRLRACGTLELMLLGPGEATQARYALSSLDALPPLQGRVPVRAPKSLVIPTGRWVVVVDNPTCVAYNDTVQVTPGAQQTRTFSLVCPK